MDINEVSMGSVSLNSNITKSSPKKTEDENTNAFEEADKTSQKETVEDYGRIQSKDSKIAKVLEEIASQEEEQTPFEKGYEEGKELREKAEDKALGALGKAAGFFEPLLLGAVTGGAGVVAAKAGEIVASKADEVIDKAADASKGKVIDLIEKAGEALDTPYTPITIGLEHPTKDLYEKSE